MTHAKGPETIAAWPLAPVAYCIAVTKRYLLNLFPWPPSPCMPSLRPTSSPSLALAFQYL